MVKFNEFIKGGKNMAFRKTAKRLEYEALVLRFREGDKEALSKLIEIDYDLIECYSEEIRRATGQEYGMEIFERYLHVLKTYDLNSKASLRSFFQTIASNYIKYKCELQIEHCGTLGQFEGALKRSKLHGAQLSYTIEEPIIRKVDACIACQKINKIIRREKTRLSQLPKGGRENLNGFDYCLESLMHGTTCDVIARREGLTRQNINRHVITKLRFLRKCGESLSDFRYIASEGNEKQVQNLNDLLNQK